MLFFVVGLSGRFAEWCGAVTLQLTERALGGGEMLRADTLEEVSRSLLRSRLPNGVVASHQPGGRLGRALVEAGRPFILALDDPRAALADLVARQGLGMAAATQMLASSCASITCFGAAPGALVLRAEHDGKDPAGTAAAIARHLRLDLTDADAATIVRGLDETGAVLESREGAAWWEALDGAERVIASGALGPYIDRDAGPSAAPLTWARELFFVGDQSTERLSGGVDITGRTRCLLHGPKIMLPPGIWSLSAAFDVSPEAAEHSFLVEVRGGPTLSRTIIRPSAAGRFEANLTLTLEELPDQPIDLLLYSERAAFDGHLTLLHVTLSPQPLAPSAGSSETAAPQ